MSDKKEDALKITGQIGDNAYTAVRRNAEGDHPVVFHTVSDGEPLAPGGELLSVHSECRDGWHKVDVVYRDGPAQVATPAYRDGWDRIFGGKQDVGLA